MGAPTIDAPWPAGAIEYGYSCWTSELRFVLKAIVTGQATYDFAAFPILEDTAQVFAGNSGYGCEVALPDFVLNDDAVRSDISPEMMRQFKQRVSNATSQR